MVQFFSFYQTCKVTNNEQDGWEHYLCMHNYYHFPASNGISTVIEIIKRNWLHHE